MYLDTSAKHVNFTEREILGNHGDLYISPHCEWRTVDDHQLRQGTWASKETTDRVDRGSSHPNSYCYVT